MTFCQMLGKQRVRIWSRWGGVRAIALASPPGGAKLSYPLLQDGERWSLKGEK
jgi:hypothetical protein